MTSSSLMPESGSVRDLRIEQLAWSTNEILSIQDPGIICELLSKAQGDIDSLDADISSLETALESLKERRALSVEQMMRLRVGISSQKKLPPEMLAKIFVECADNQEQEVPIPRQHTPCIGWDLGHVCTRWRGIARTIPLLWAKINVSLRNGNSSSPAAFHLLHDILSNCGGQGRVQLKINPATPSDWATLLDLIAAYSSRLWGLDLQLDDTCLEPLSLPIRGLDNLQSLSLSFLDALHTNQISILGFCTSRSIQTVTLWFNAYPHFPDHQQQMLPWDLLTSLTLTLITPDSVLFIVGHCSLLTKLTVGLRAGSDIHNHAMELPISLAHLRSMTIYHDFDDVLDDLLSQLVLPSLQEYHYGGDNESLGYDPSGFLALVERSACVITLLDIQDPILDLEDIIPVMRTLPTLTELSVVTLRPTPDSMLSIIKTENLMPNLRTFKGCEFPSVHSAMEFLNSRWSQTISGNSDGLKHLKFWVTMDNCSLDDQTYFESLLPELEKHGRQVEFHVLDS